MVSDEELAKYAFKPEIDEEKRFAEKVSTGYPKPLNRYRLYVEGFNMSIEEPYFWVLEYLRYMWGYTYTDKITDIFAAAENSSFFGSSQQRLGAQQDKVSQYLATVGKMVKELFQLVRELRVLDERLSYYVDSYDAESKSRESAEITLKGIWVDMVEQGAKNPASVYGMAREVQFTTLPDLFFSTHPLRQEDVDEYVDTHRAEFNRKVREVLKRKLRTFLTWKEHTFEEIKTRRKFTLKYLRQHYEIIRMYMAWVKPYLKNVQRLQMDQTKMDTADLLVAFETSLIEVEILARRPLVKGFTPVILVHFWFRTRPEMSYQQEGWQKGPLHVGRVEINFRAYAWSQKEIDSYKEMKKEEEFQLLGMIDASVKAAMEALGDELMKYLAEAGEEGIKARKESKKLGEPEKPTAKTLPLLKPFTGVASLFSPYKAAGKKAAQKPSREKAFLTGQNRETAAKEVERSMWNIYHHFKKHHGMLNW